MVSTRAVPAISGTLTSDQLDELRAQLEQQRRFRLDQLAALRAGDEQHGEIAATLTTAAHAALNDITAALRRIADGTYGSCTECGRPLPLERLEMVPQVGRCGACLRPTQP